MEFARIIICIFFCYKLFGDCFIVLLEEKCNIMRGGYIYSFVGVKGLFSNR